MTDYVDGQIGSPIPLSCRKLLYFQWMRNGEWKIHSEIRGKEWKNNIHRVLFPTQICQFWDTAYSRQRNWLR